MGILDLQSVTYRYESSGKDVLKDVSMSFERGKIYAVVGKSGAGKSTLLNLIAGLDVATSGRVSFDGADLSQCNRDYYRARKAGIVFQGFNLLTNATALDNILLSMRISGVKGTNKKARALGFLAKVGISPQKAGRNILKLSGGEQQRVGIARALSHNPELIAADEPTGNLDADTAKGILEILAALAHDEDRCVIIVTHSKEAASIADEIWRVDGGVLNPVQEEGV